jgi:hypothetical protein
MMIQMKSDLVRTKLWIAAVCLLLSSCYSFTGASLPPHIKTIAVPLADDISGFGQADVRQRITELLTDKFTQDGSLQVTNRSRADAIVEATIRSITDENVGVQQGEQLTTKRVTLFVDVVYRDQKKQKDFWQRSFTAKGEYPIEQMQTGLRNALTTAEEQLAEDILLAVISNW